MLIKGIAQGFKDVDTKQGIVTGYFAHFGSKDSDGDIIVRGAFSKSIQENGPKSRNPRIKHLLDHKRDKAIGLLTDLYEDEVGLGYESKAGRHADGRDFLLMVEDGIITEHSHGFQIIKEQQKSDANYIQESRLYEGSSLQFWGANGNTPITGVKSAADMIDDLNTLERGLKNGKYTDETFKRLEERIKSLYNLLKPDSATSNDDEPTDSKSPYLSFITKS